MEAIPAIYRWRKFQPTLSWDAMLIKRAYTSEGDVLDGAGLALGDGGRIVDEILNIHFGREGGKVIVKRR